MARFNFRDDAIVVLTPPMMLLLGAVGGGTHVLCGSSEWG